MESQETMQLLCSLIRQIPKSTLTRLINSTSEFEGSASGGSGTDRADESSSVAIAADVNERSSFTFEELLSQPNRKKNKNKARQQKNFG